MALTDTEAEGDAISTEDAIYDISGGSDIYESKGARAYFRIPEDKRPQNFYFFPFPSDLLINSDGTLNIDGFPNPANIDLLDTYISIVKHNFSGFSTQGAIYIKFDSPLDRSTLPSDPLETLKEDSPLFLINVTDNEYRGERVPILVRFVEKGDKYISSNTLIATPENGFVLRRGNKYAFVVTKKVRGIDGLNISSPKDFEYTKKESALSDERLERARLLYAPVYRYLESIGVKREEIAIMTVFTTQDPVRELIKIREYLIKKGDFRFKEVKTDKLDSNYCGIEGKFETYQFQKGDPPYDDPDSGMFEFGEDGEPILQRREEVRFYLSIPSIDMPQDGFPLVMYAHGTGGDYKSFAYSGIASNLASVGVAVVSFDQPLHGARNTGNWSEDMKTFNMTNILASRDNIRQSAIDTDVLMHIFTSNSIVGGISCSGKEIRFDRKKVFFFGHSQGGLTGPLFVAIEPDVKAALFSEGGGRFVISVYQKTEPSNIPQLVRTLLCIDEGDYDIDLFHPVLNLIQIIADPADPANYGRLLIKNPVCNGDICRPKHIFMTEGTKDPYTPPDAIEALAMSIGVNPYGEIYRSREFFEKYGLPVVTKDDLPNNVYTEDGKGSSTGVLVQFKDQEHFPVFVDSRAIDMYKTFFYNLSYRERAVLEE